MSPSLKLDICSALLKILSKGKIPLVSFYTNKQIDKFDSSSLETDETTVVVIKLKYDENTRDILYFLHINYDMKNP